ncbi:unnamed protein product [Rotaria sordida]|uniref:Uncharacterized protein n=1 Tax=Rotaria sordida TaxID=392033 RepID=A0A815PPJ7_9BILA|nr:unnamed protein product [Rotaria sordida]CAF1452089.1 unnamed protein product [Rotaria sordida]CAF1476178.1 unnamed protein product [Rotaria sordida]
MSKYTADEILYMQIQEEIAKEHNELRRLLRLLVHVRSLGNATNDIVADIEQTKENLYDLHMAKKNQVQNMSEAQEN